MSASQPPVPADEELSAYVDGELAPDNRARVAHAVAADAALAARVAVLSKLKAAVAGLADERPVTLGDLDLPLSRARLPRRAIAASMLALLLIAAAGGAYWLWRDSAEDAWVAQVKLRHLAWISAAETPAAGDLLPVALRAALDGFAGAAHIPDMSGAKLTLTDIAVFRKSASGAAEGVQLRYTGLRGCRVSLWLSRGKPFPDESLAENDDGASRGFTWRVGGVSYALFATGMDHARLTLLARTVYEATRANHAPPEPRQHALRVASDAATPCRA
jgi:anti-sigma factor RsiW